MTAARQNRADRRAICALVAVFALMVQALIPAAAMAADARAAGLPGALVICTGHGTETLGLDGKAAPGSPGSHRGFGGMPCQDCLAAAIAAVAPSPAADIQLVVYRVARVDHAPAVSLLAPRARAPPRPPGQGPPTA